MGVRNRERRAAKSRTKQRARRRTEGRPGFVGWAPAPTAAELAVVVRCAAEACAGGDGAVAAGEWASALVGGAFGGSPTVVARAVDLAALDGVTHCWRRGWQPADLWQLARRERDERTVGYLVDLLAAESSGYAAAALAPAWSAQLRRLGAEVWWRPDQPHLVQWAARHGMARADAVATVVELLAMLWALPPLSQLVPPPGSAGARAAAAAGGGGAAGVDPKVLARVRALLAKAESTDFDEEAEALFAKAQELMSRYSLERAVLDAAGGAVDEGPGGRRIWLDAPYVSAKSMLVSEVARANRSRTVLHEDLGCVTVLGAEVDLTLVEVLSTALLVHAGGQLLAAGRQTDRRGRSRTKSFRQSFLVSYATRIGERLTAASAAATETVAGSVGEEALLPVLAARDRRVEELFESLFPSSISRRVSVTNAAGWGAGRVAADLADLDVRRAVGG